MGSNTYLVIMKTLKIDELFKYTKQQFDKFTDHRAGNKQYSIGPGYLLLAVDGVHHFSSKSVSCTNCLERNHSDGTITYSHSMLASVITHPTKKIVIPLCEEPIVQQDGQTKNDCEINAAIRLFDKTRTQRR